MDVILRHLPDRETVKELICQVGFLKNFLNFAKSNKIMMRVCSLALIGIMSVGVSIAAAGITLGLKVNYAGAIIATIKNSGVFDTARKIAVDHIESSDAESVIENPSFSMTLTVSNRLDSAVTVADAIIENTGDVVKAAALNVNGERVACSEPEVITSLLEARRTEFDIEGAQNSSELTDDVETVGGYFLKSEVTGKEELSSVIESLEVKTVSVITSDTEIPFSKETVKTSKQLIGYSKVTTAGQNGITRKTENIEAVNGEVVTRTELDSIVVKEPVTQVTTVGTAISTASPAQRSEERSAGFICPLKRGSFVITSYYGDGRNHKGMDLGADKGTPIYAAAAGTVISSGYEGDYGYSVVIDHGNGYKTRYAHASALCVKKGQTVSQGDVVAYVGSTGYSTGNHLHFEIIKNGSRVNPVSYIGLD